MTSRTEQHGVNGERGGDAEELSDVVDVVDVLADEHGSRSHGGRVRVNADWLERRTLRDGEHATVKVDSRERFDGLIACGIERRGAVMEVHQFHCAREHARAGEH